MVIKPLIAQTQRQKITLSWSTEANRKINGVVYPVFTNEKNAILNDNQLPLYTGFIRLNGNKNVQVAIENAQYTTIHNGALQNATSIKNSIPELEFHVVYEKKIPHLAIKILPFRNSNGRIEKLENFDLVIQSSGNSNPVQFGKAGFAAQSVLANGDWYRLYVKNTGIHRITKSYLKAMGINPDEIDPRTIKIYGNGPGTITTPNANERMDDLWENPIQVKGESDGKFDEEDEVLFYGKSQQDVWSYDAGSGTYIHQNNYYSDATVYFITFGGNNGKRIVTAAALTPNQTNDGHYDFLYVHEMDNINLIRSGRRWFGEEFSRELNQTFQANLENANGTIPVFFRSSVIARAFTPSTYDVRINNNYIFSQQVPAASSNFEYRYADEKLSSGTFTTGTNIIQVNYRYNQPAPGALGWLDYFELQSRNYLNLTKPQLLLKDKNSLGAGKITQFNLVSNATTQIWDVTKPYQAIQLPTIFTANTNSFVAATDTLREFIAFDGSSYFTPETDTKISNQNIHGMPFADLFIVTHPNFLFDANRLAELRRSQGLTVNVVTINQVYNEFSSGMQDISAIRDMMRMFYKKATVPAEMPKYLLLVGRASYDYKSRVAINTNYIPTFESYNSFDPVGSYCSDDYFGLLDDNEGNMNSWEKLDIGIGRLPATNADNARVMINKIINYSINPDRSDWKNRLTFVADDEDGNLHQSQADGLAENARANFKNYNVQKIYIDAFKEVTTAGGARNPSAQEEIVRSVERGCMVFNYTGHGGEVGLAAERILNTSDVQNWTNGGKLPLFFTATCEFSRFDDPARFSAGEYVLLNENGGGIGLCTTVRLVDAGNNNSLNIAFYKYAGLDSVSAYNRLLVGEIMRKTKNDVLSDNTRNFTLLGDPSMMLAYPEKRVYTAAIDNIPIASYTDTLKAFSKVTISGRVTDLAGNILTGFSGKVYPTVFDKTATYQTIANNPEFSSPFNFNMQNNVIYRGSATVLNGTFSFSFIVPKDISYQIGTGRISYYAENGSIDAHGYDNKILVGGTADSAGVDQIGPEISLFMNDEKFVFGGLTDENPMFIAKLKDYTGINITGVGIGRELGLTLNNDNTTTTSMNDYYRAKIDSYQQGEVRYPMKGMPLGKNSVKLIAWDVYNNYNESVLDFVVAGSAEMALQHVLNYPNPFTTNTTFHFDHNKPGQNLKVSVQIFTVSGKLIKTLQTELLASGSHFDQISWDGKDEYGDGIGKGVYIYKVKVKSEEGKSVEEFQKLVVLN